MENFELKKDITDVIRNNEDYKREYENNTLFHQIIEGITDSDNIVESFIDAIYSYNQMLSSVVSTIAQTADEKTVQAAINNFESVLKEDK